MQVWSTTFPGMLQRFAVALKGGSRIKELKILIGTWYKPLILSDEHAAAFEVLGEMRIRGQVQVRTQGIFDETKNAIRAWQLEKKMKDNGGRQTCFEGFKAGGKYLDWDWEGGGVIT